MEDILFLVHRIPFPPNKGDKIRSFNLLKWLSKHYQVHLGYFVDEPEDEQYKSELAPYCKLIHAVSINKMYSTLRSSVALFSAQALTVPYYFRLNMQSWVDEVINARNIQKAIVYSSSMAQYLDGPKYQNMCRVIDFVDVDSDKWRQYAQSKKIPLSWIYQREHRLLQRYEVHISEQFKHATFVSEEESNFFESLLAPALAQKISSVGNGVDTIYFDRRNLATSKQPEPRPYIVFTGAMDYWANVDAMLWFCQQVWPIVKQNIPELELYIVGSNPSSKVKELEAIAGVVVTGRVDDIRPYIDRALVTVAPLLIARGIQNKVLEAMAMEKPIVATRAAIEGITRETTDLAVSVCDQARDFGNAVIEYCQKAQNKDSSMEGICYANRQFVLDNFSWDSQLNSFQPLLENE